MQITDTIGSIAANDIRTTQVFQRYNIDFCCGGRNTVIGICEKKGINPRALLHELHRETSQPCEEIIDFNTWETSQLIEYIVKEHHSYVRKGLPLLRAYAEKIAREHGTAHLYLLDIKNLVVSLIGELIPHLLTEENYVFPFISEKGKGKNGTSVRFQGILEDLTKEHYQVTNMMKMLSILTGQFTPPEYACHNWKTYYHHLAEFRENLYVHLHLENNILFPRAWG